MNLAIESLFLRSKPAPCVFSALRQSASVGQPPVRTVTCGRTHRGNQVVREDDTYGDR